jgi:hypothetical protein
LWEVRGGRGQGRTAIVLASLGAAMRGDEVAALIDFSGSFDPAPAVRAGVSLDRLLWVRGPSRGSRATETSRTSRTSEGQGPASLAARRTGERQLIAAAEAIVAAGGFGVVALDFGEHTPMIPTAAWLRLRRLVTAPGTVLLVSTTRAPANLFGATSLCLEGGHPRFVAEAQTFARAAPPLLEGIEIDARLVRAAHGTEMPRDKTAVKSPRAGRPRLTLVHRPT